MQSKAWWCAVLVLVGIAVFAACTEEETGTVRTTAGQGQAQRGDTSETLEYKLAVVHKGGFVAEDDPLVSQFGRLLDSLTGKCRNGRQGVSDIGVRAQEILKERGVDLSLLEVMKGIDGSIPQEASGLDCADVAAAFVTLIVGGQ